ncbi:MAG TPA: hypothetical protein VHA13_01695, partial [Gammaproteobacteria bacterium]|nr:hypothetical protein [Gammaproteobacteria bacterium]
MNPSVKKAKRYTRYAVTAVLLTGMVLVTGFLSFTGMLVLHESIYLAIAAFFLGGGIEGEVYAQNISSALLKLFSGKYWEEAILDKTLNRLIENDKANESFFKDYKKLQNYIAELEHSHHHSKEVREKLKLKKKELFEMRRIFRYYLINDPKISPLEKRFHKEFDAALIELAEKEHGASLNLSQTMSPEERKKVILTHIKQGINSEIRQKTWLSRLSGILTLGAGISCGLVGL